MSATRLGMYSRGTTGRLALLNADGGNHLSGLERDLLLVLDFDPRVRRIEAEPFSVVYDADGQQRRYTPDALAEFELDGQRWTDVYEVKFRDDLQRNWEEYRARFRAATAHCRAQGWRFKLMTEKEIRVPELSNFKFLRRYRSIKADPLQEEALLLTMTALGPAKVKDVLTATWYDKERQMQALAYVWRLLAIGLVNADLSQPLTMSTSIWR